MAPLANRKLERPADYRRQIDEAEDFIGYSLIAATVAAGVVLAVVFAAF
jgi:hypothetical protein